MNNFFASILVVLLALLIMFNVSYRAELKATKQSLTEVTLTKDSLRNANALYDTILTSILTDTNKITLNLELLIKDKPELKKVVAPMVNKKKPGFFKRLFN